MKQKLFLTSAIAMGFIVPAFAEPFPTDGYMKENKTYDEAATFENTGVYDGEVDATAEYDNTPYSVAAGLYFTGVNEDTNAAITATCTAGSYCPGVTSTTYDYTTDEFGNAGIQLCPTIDNTAFTSDAGSSALTNCYDEDTAMSSAELNPFNTAHLDTSVSGSGYINGVKYKSATTTARRYATTATTAGEWAALDPSDLEITDLACANGYHYKAGLNVEDTIGNTTGENSAYINNSGSFSGTGGKDKTYYGISDNMSWAVDYGDKGMLIGQGRCSTQAGSNGWYTDGQYDSNGDWSNTTKVSNLTDETGQTGATYCYCNVTGYKDASGNMQNLSSLWVFSGYNDAANCVNGCANGCAHVMLVSYSGYLAFRAALLGSVSASPAMCEANTITINWSDVKAADVTANNAGTATYGEDVRTPVKANTYKGKTFKGWRFSKPEQTNL